MNSVTLLLILLFAMIVGLGAVVFVQDLHDSRERSHPSRDK